MNRRLLLVHFFYFLIVFLLSAKQTVNSALDVFLEKSAVRIDSLDFIGNINKYLNYELDDNKRPVWFDGSLLTQNGESFHDLNINFNVLDNSLYVLYDDNIYRLSNSHLKSFDIKQGGEKLKFRKGYGIPFEAEISAELDGSSYELLYLLTSYNRFSDFEIKKITVTEDSKTSFRISLRAKSRDEISGLIHYFKSNDKIDALNSSYVASELGESKYVQVLFENENFQVVKFYFKRNATAETLSVIKNSSSFVFEDEDYFIADSRKKLHEFIFTKRSIEKVLASLGITYTQDLKRVPNEGRVIDWFKSNKFSLIN